MGLMEVVRLIIIRSPLLSLIVLVEGELARLVIVRPMALARFVPLHVYEAVVACRLLLLLLVLHTRRLEGGHVARHHDIAFLRTAAAMLPVRRIWLE